MALKNQKKNKLVISKDCTACELCTMIAPEVFRMEKSKEKAVPIKEVLENKDITDDIKDAISSCPVRAIRLDNLTKTRKNGYSKNKTD